VAVGGPAGEHGEGGGLSGGSEARSDASERREGERPPPPWPSPARAGEGTENHAL
jgi:hypothetical protein